jgi:CheY-like chemotaxis protein
MKTVLILTASEEMTQFLRRSLGTQYRLITGSSRNASLLLQSRPDALILELSQPGCTGLEVLEDCRPFLPPVVIGLSALTFPPVVEEAAAAGVTCMIRIPFTAREIAFRLKNSKKIPSHAGGEGLSEGNSV